LKKRQAASSARVLNPSDWESPPGDQRALGVRPGTSDRRGYGHCAMRDLIAAGPVEPLDTVDVKRLGFQAQSFMDINTPEDLAAAREISSQSRPSTSSG
jgi:hypothetical protein